MGFVHFGLVGWGRQVAIFSPNSPFGNMAVPTRLDPNESMFCSVITQYGGLQNAADAANNLSGVPSRKPWIPIVGSPAAFAARCAAGP